MRLAPPPEEPEVLLASSGKTLIRDTARSFASRRSCSSRRSLRGRPLAALIDGSMYVRRPCRQDLRSPRPRRDRAGQRGGVRGDPGVHRPAVGPHRELQPRRGEGRAGPPVFALPDREHARTGPDWGEYERRAGSSDRGTMAAGRTAARHTQRPRLHVRVAVPQPVLFPEVMDYDRGDDCRRPGTDLDSSVRADAVRTPRCRQTLPLFSCLSVRSDPRTSS